MAKRKAFNGELDRLEMCTLFIFLNRTCFNGLYRENKKENLMFPLASIAHQRFAMKIQFWKIAKYCSMYTY